MGKGDRQAQRRKKMVGRKRLELSGGATLKCARLNLLRVTSQEYPRKLFELPRTGRDEEEGIDTSVRHQRTALVHEPRFSPAFVAAIPRFSQTLSSCLILASVIDAAIAEAF